MRRILEAREQNVTPPDAAAIRNLASKIAGQLITPDSPDYESSRLIFNRAFDQRPALIVRCASASDVARSLEFSQSQNLPLAVRGGGHNRAGFSVCDGGVVIDLSGMTRASKSTQTSAWLVHRQAYWCVTWTRRRSDSASPPPRVVVRP
jgi:hypothetical protein